MKHPGNFRLGRIVVRRYLKRYTESGSKSERSLIVTEIVRNLKEEGLVGAFVEKVCDRWSKASDQLAQETVRQLLRHLNTEKHKPAKRARKSKCQVGESQVFNEVKALMGQVGNPDISSRVKELTRHAMTDVDFQEAFNRANSELLDSLKKHFTGSAPSKDQDQDRQRQETTAQQQGSSTRDLLPGRLVTSEPANNMLK